MLVLPPTRQMTLGHSFNPSKPQFLIGKTSIKSTSLGDVNDYMRLKEKNSINVSTTVPGPQWEGPTVFMKCKSFLKNNLIWRVIKLHLHKKGLAPPKLQNFNL